MPEIDSEGSEAGAKRSLSGRAILATLWTAAGSGSAEVLRLLSNLALARLLFPEAFGLMAIVNMVLAGLKMLSNVGIGPAVIRHEAGDQAGFLDTAWTMQVARGALLAATVLLLAPLLASFYEDPLLQPLLSVAALVPLVDGLASTRLLLRTRALDLRPVMMMTFFAKLTSVIAMVGTAIVYRSVWVLVLGAVSMAVVRTVLSYLIVPGPRQRLAVTREALRQIWDFGRWVFVSTIFTYVGRRADVIFLGKVVPLDVLGLYSIAIVFVGVGQRFFLVFTQAVLMPALSEARRRDPATLGEALLRAKGLTLPGCALLLLAQLTATSLFFDLLYDDRYQEAIWMAQMAFLAVWFEFLQDTNVRALLAIGDSRAVATSNGVRSVVAITACFVGFELFGLPGVILGIASAPATGLLLVLAALKRHGIRIGWIDLQITLATTGVGLLLVFAPREIAAQWASPMAELSSILLGAAILVVPAIWFGLRARAALANR